MTDAAIKVDRLSKRYRIGAREDARGPLSFLGAPFRYLGQQLRGPSEEEVLWALKDVSFEVRRGEVLGLIGANGAGKSTLLKILARITEPTEGRAEIRGRLGSLLEVGTGFHPELTGRENVYLSGAILGMKRAEIAAKFDRIVEFSGVEKFMDTPVKRYSSGMYVRLAFAVAAHLEPEVLLVDEVLAVGDAAFQKKCLGRMGEAAREGRTVLFVSHNMLAVQQLCSRVLWFSAGAVAAMGNASDIVGRYLGENAEQLTEQAWSDPAEAPGNDLVRLRRVALEKTSRKSDSELRIDDELAVFVEFWDRAGTATLDVTLQFSGEQGVVAFSTSTIDDPRTSATDIPGLYRATCIVPANLLNAATYSVSVLFVRNRADLVFRMPDALSFRAHERLDRAGAWFGRRQGAVRPRLDWRMERVES